MGWPWFADETPPPQDEESLTSEEDCPHCGADKRMVEVFVFPKSRAYACNNCSKQWSEQR